MLRVRSDGGLLDADQAARARQHLHRLRPRHRRHHRPAEHPVPLDRDRERPGDLGAARRRRDDQPRGLRRLAPRRSSAPPSPASPPTRSSTPPRRSRRSSAATSATRSTPTSRASSRPRPAATRASTASPRSTTSRSSAPSTPSTAPASTSGSAAACPPTRCSPRSSASGSRSTRCADAWEGVTSVFRDYGYRRLRSRARLKFLVADWGVEKFREVLETEYLDRKLVDGPSPEATGPTGDHVGVHEQKDGKFYVGVAADRRPHLRRDADQRSATSSRSTALPAPGSPRTRSSSCSASTRPTSSRSSPTSTTISLEARPSNWRRSTMACTGIEFCKLAIVDTKQRAIDLVAELEQRFPDLDTPITVNVNGCPNACARTQVADIGLKGMLVLDDDGNQVEGFQVHLGGGLGLTHGFGKKLRAPQGHQRRPRRLRHHRRRQLPARPRGRRDASPPGRSAPTRSCSAARRPSDERPRRSLPLPLLRGREPLPARGRPRAPARRLGMPRRACGRSSVNMIGQLRPPASHHAATEASDDRPHTLAARARRGSDTEGRSTEELARDRLPRRAPSSSSRRPRTSSSGPSPPSATASASPRR